MGCESVIRNVKGHYIGKPVPPKYQKRYGKRYSAAEAEEIARRIIAKRRG